MSLKSTKAIAYSLCGAMSFALLSPAFALAQAPAVPANPFPAPAGQAVAEPMPAGQPAAAPAAQDGMQVLEQGPVHEAFAEPVVLEAAARVKVDRAPPDPVNEVPPEVRPEGANVEWISGYWMWSDQQNDFIWVSGVWREIPPGRRWVPGHWAKGDAGFEWVSGFWAAQQVQEVNMLPNPPETLEVGPSSPAPAANYFWVPGIWAWQNGGYGWRAGYWYAGQDDWIWVPDHYCYTPRGAIFVSGYWDFLMINRGLLYAPVYYSRPIYADAGYFYRPRSVINTALLLSALFVNNHHHHYYYGYGGWGGNNFYRPWWSNSWGRGHGYDPFYAYHRWHDGRNRHDWHDHVRRDWDNHHRDWDRNRQDGDWDRDGDRGGRGGGRPDNIAGRPNGDPANQLVQNVNEFRRQHTGQAGSMKLRDATPGEAQTALKRSEGWQQIREARVAAEAKAGAGGAVNLGSGNTADTSARGRGQGVVGNQRGAGQPGGGDGVGVNTGGDVAGQVGATGPGVNRRLRIDTPEGTPRGSFRLPPVEGATNVGGQVGGQVNGGVAGGATAQQSRGAAARAWQSNRVGSQGGGTRGGVQTLPGAIGAGNVPSTGGVGQPSVGQSPPVQRGRVQLEPNSGSQFEPRVTYPGRNPAGSQPGGGNSQFRRSGGSPIQQGGGVTVPGGGQIQVPQGSSSPGRSFRFNPGASGGQGQPAFQGGGQPSVRVPSGGGGQRSFSVPSGGGQPAFRGSPSGGGSGQRSIQVPSGGGSSFRGSSGGGGGGQQQFRSGGGGGGGQMNRGGGGGGGNRGGGGGGGRGRD